MDADLPGTAMQSSTVGMNVNLDGKEVSDQVQKQMAGLNKLSRDIGYPVTFAGPLSSEKPVQQPVAQPKQNGYGVAIAMLLWAACIFTFAIFAPFLVWVRGCADVVGFVALLIGILGTCIEVFKGKP